MAPPHACTIVSNNYLPFARVLARSFLAHHPDGIVHTLVVDEPSPDVDYEAEPFVVTFAHELQVPAFRSFAFRYSILELNTAVKPYFLQELQRRTGCERLCYFDPDILVTSDLSELYRLLAGSDVVLTPHVLEPIEDDEIPSERDLLLSGIYNLGFLGISFNEHTERFLDWWQRRLYRDCRHAVEKGLFVDQKWMDFAPAFLPNTRVLRDPGYNVAYWNLPHRRLCRQEDRYFVGDEPLRFFHFSGFSPESPEGISRYQNRFTLADRPDLHGIFDHYSKRLAEEGYQELRELPYGFGSFANGDAIPSTARTALQQIDPDGERWADPFATDGDASFYAWLAAPVDPTLELRLPRVGSALWDERDDLQLAFPEPLGRDLERFSRWLVRDGLREAGIPARMGRGLEETFAQPLEGAADEGTEPPPDPWQSWQTALLTSSDARETAASFAALDLTARRWLLQEASLDEAHRPLVPRLAMTIHQQRPDLRHQFPEPLGSDREPFARWFVTFGRSEYLLPAAVVRPVVRTLPLVPRLKARLWGIRNLSRRAPGGPTR